MSRHRNLLKVGMLILVAGLLIVWPASYQARPLAADWTGWGYAVQTQVQNNVASELPAGYTVDLLLDTAALQTQGRLLGDCADLRVSYLHAGLDVELDRLVSDCNTTATRVRFKTQAAIAASGVDGEYWLHFGNPAAGAPPTNVNNVLAFFDDFEDGDAAGWISADGTWAPASETGNGFYRYSGGGTNWAISYVPMDGMSNLDLSARMRASANTSWVGLAFRIQDPANFLTFYESKDVGLFKRARIVTDNHAIFEQPAFVMAPDQWYRIHVQAVGASLRANIWLDGANEPSSWMISATDATFQGATGFGATLYQHVSNVDWDDVMARKLVSVEPTVSLNWGGLVWWDNAWGYRRNLSVTNTSASEALLAHYSVRMVLDTASLIGNDQMKPDCSDLRIVTTGGPSPVELDRVVEGCNTASTGVWFGLQRPVAAGGHDDNYYLYYGNPAAGSAPVNAANVFLFYEDWEQGTLHWTNAAGLDAGNTGTMGHTEISTQDYVSPANSQKFPVKAGGGDAFSGYIPVSASTGYAIGVWAKAGENTNAPVGFDPYTSDMIKGTEVWLWAGEWTVGPQWAYRSGRFTTTAGTAYIKIKSEWWAEAGGSQPVYMDNLVLRYALASEPGIASGDEETILTVPTISNIADNGPVALGSALTVSADVTSTDGTVDAVMLRISAPQAADVPMTLISGDNLNGRWQGNFTPTQGGVYHYRVRALASTGRSKLSEERTATVSDTQPPQITLVSVIDPILVRNTQTLTVHVTDNGQISAVSVSIGGVSHPMTLQGGDYAYSWQVTSVGSVNYIVTATDTSNNTATLPGSFSVQAREVDVCTWKDCKSGASSFSMDDGNNSCRAELEAAGIRGTYFWNGSGQTSWHATYSAAGHEIASHTVGHACNPPQCFPNCTPESWAAIPVDPAYVNDYRQNQLDPNIQSIEASTGKPVLALAWPCGCVDPSREQAASYYYLGSRGYYDWVALLPWVEDVNLPTPFDFQNLNSAASYRQDFIDRAIAEGKWAITTSHGSCAGIDYMGSRSDVLWNAPVGEVLKYIKVRDASQFSNYSRVGRTITFDVIHNLPVMSRQTLAGEALLPIVFDNPITLKAHIQDTDTVLNVLVDGAPVAHQVIVVDGAKYVTFNAPVNTLRHVTVNLSESLPTIGAITDNGPVEINATATVNAVVTNPGGAVGPVILRLIAPRSGDIPMNLVAGQPDTYTANFSPQAEGAQTYRVRAANTDGLFAESAIRTINVNDASAPTFRNQAQSLGLIPPGGSNTLSVEGLDPGGLYKATLMTDESGAWQEFDLPTGDWWDFRWTKRKPVVVSETAGLARQAELVDLTVSAAQFGGLTSCVNDLRVAGTDRVELPVQVVNEHLDAGVLTCNLLFQANVPANGSRTYFVYWGNPAATPPAYTTDLSAIAGASVTTVASSFFDIDLDNDSAIIARMRLPQGENTNLPLSSESNSYWGFHQVCSSLDGNISGKDAQCVSGSTPATGLTLQGGLAGPLVREYTVTNIKSAATYSMRFRFVAGAPYYQYSLTRTGSTSTVMNNFWYLNGNFARLGYGTGGTPAVTYNSYANGADLLRMASFSPVAAVSIDGVDNDGTDLGGTDYMHPTADGLALNVVTGLDPASIDATLAKIAAPLGAIAGATENVPTGQHGSPVFLNGATGWIPATFTWRNPAIPAGQTVQWRVKLCDLSGNCVETGIQSFLVQLEPTCVTYQRGVLGTVQDTYVWQALPSNSYTTAATLYTGLRSHVVQGMKETRLMLHFDLNDLPEGILVQSATLGMTVFNSPAGEVIQAHPVTTAWTEATRVTWSAYAAAYDPAVSGQFTAQTGAVSADITTLVQSWVDGSRPNDGLMLINAGTNAGTLYRASEYATAAGRPWLRVCYVPSFGAPAAIEVTPDNATLPSGGSQAYTVTARDAQGHTWDVTGLAQLSVDTAAGGTWNANVYTAQNQGVWTVTAVYDGLTDTTGLTVAEHGAAVQIELSPAAAGITAGASQAYTLLATDALGNTWDVTALGAYNLDAAAGGSWVGAVYISEKAGAWTVTAQYNGLSDTASLNVAHAAAVSVDLAPAGASIPSGSHLTYQTSAVDAFGNSWDVSLLASYAISAAAGGSWNANVYTAEVAGNWTVTSTYLGLSDTAALEVTGWVEPTCVTYQRGLPGTVEDTYVWQALPGNSYTTAATLYTGLRSHVTQGLKETRLMLRFGLEGLPAGASIQSATFGLTVFNSPAGETIQAHPVTTAWNEATKVTWTAFAAAYDPAVSGQFTTQTGAVSADITGLVQSWVDGSRPNNGLMLLNAGTNAGNLYRGSEYATASARPWLRVCYLPGTGAQAVTPIALSLWNPTVALGNSGLPVADLPRRR